MEIPFRGSTGPPRRIDTEHLRVRWAAASRDGEHDNNVRAQHGVGYFKPDSSARTVTALGVVRGTTIAATLGWAIGEMLMRRSSTSDRLARASWTAGIVLALVHASSPSNS
jgi:hypothetical protein